MWEANGMHHAIYSSGDNTQLWSIVPQTLLKLMYRSLLLIFKFGKSFIEQQTISQIQPRALVSPMSAADNLINTT